MEITNEFDLKEFQSKVFKDFELLKANVAFTKLYKDRQKLKNRFDMSFSIVGVFTRFVFSIFSFLGKRNSQVFLNKPDFIKKTEIAKGILESPKIRILLCAAFQKEITSELLDKHKQVKIVRIITTLLTKNDMLKEHSPDPDFRLFSIMVLNLWQKGLGNYCK
jgi:hypothetical protein